LLCDRAERRRSIDPDAWILTGHHRSRRPWRKVVDNGQVWHRHGDRPPASDDARTPRSLSFGLDHQVSLWAGWRPNVEGTEPSKKNFFSKRKQEILFVKLLLIYITDL
jgi:hypothetical protein